MIVSLPEALLHAVEGELENHDQTAIRNAADALSLAYRGQRGMGFRRRPAAVVDGPVGSGTLDLPLADELPWLGSLDAYERLHGRGCIAAAVHVRTDLPSPT